MEYNEITGLMQEMAKTGVTRIMIEKDNFRLELERSGAAYGAVPVIGEGGNAAVMPGMQPGADVKTESAANAENNKSDVALNTDESTYKKILSPMVGTFYAQPAPDKPPYVSVGDTVKKGQIVCIIEAMKLMNEIESDVSGRIVKCLVNNEEMVEYGQPLFLVE